MHTRTPFVVHTARLHGVGAIPGEVTAAPSPTFQLAAAGLASQERVREQQIRVRSALGALGEGDLAVRVEVNAAESYQDLAAALGALGGAYGWAPVRDRGFLGELALNGRIRPVRGLVVLVEALVRTGIPTIVVPRDQLSEVRHLQGMGMSGARVGARIFGADALEEVVEWIVGDGTLPDALSAPAVPPAAEPPTLADVRGLDEAKAALRAALRERRNVLLVGPPGSGRTMLARRAVGLLPPPDVETERDGRRIRSVAGMPPSNDRPFRAPHHTASASALLGSEPRRGVFYPGEVSLAHGGVLFLDEIDRFRREARTAVFQAVRQGEVRRGVLTIPAAPVMIAAMDLCECGWTGTSRPCRCTADAHRRHAAVVEELTGPAGIFQTRIDLPTQPTATILAGA